MTYREAVYMVLDEVKNASDDSFYTEDHVLFLLGKYRAVLLKQKYSDIKKPIPESNYQTICLNLEESFDNLDFCGNSTYLRSKEEVPFMMKIGTTSVFPVNYYNGNIAFISKERMKFVGHNKFLKNIIYASLNAEDNKVYIKSANPQSKYLEKIKVIGMFEDIQKAATMKCFQDGANGNCDTDIMEERFPLEEGLISTLLEMTIKDLLGASYRPADPTNDASDDLSDLATYIRQNLKSETAKQMDKQ